MTVTATRQRVHPLTATIGAVIDGVSLRHPLDPRTISLIRETLLDRKVVCFRDQHLEPEELVNAARQFGELTAAHPVMPALAGFPEVLEIDATRSRENPLYRDELENDDWHADVTFMPTPPLGSLLSGRVVPDAGGDTLFADQQAAYDALSQPIRDLIDPLRARHDGSREFGAFLDGGGRRLTWDGVEHASLTPADHPVVRRHPETGRPGLFVNPLFTQRILGLEKKESAALLDFLFAHATSPEFQVRWRWSPGDVVFWDNRSTLHFPVRDYGDQHRVLQRVTLRGDQPV